MEVIIDVLVILIVLNCVFKLSLWHLWQRLIYSLLLGAFAWWSVRYAVLQSKTQIADFLQDMAAMQTVAILVTIESAVGLSFCLNRLQDGGSRWLRTLLYAYPCLLMFPVVFYLLTQTVFAATGIDFNLAALLFALGVMVLLPVLSAAVRWMLPDETSRLELHLLLTIFVCVLGLVATEHGRMVYAVKETPIDWHTLGLTLGLFLLLAVAGFLLNRLKWHIHSYLKKNNITSQWK